MADTLSDNGTIYGQTYDLTINGYSYVARTADHSLPVSGGIILDSSGKFKGGGYVRGQETLSVEIDAITGTPAPAQLTPFAQAFHGYASKYWAVHNLQIKSGNAQLRTYTAELKEHKATPA